MRPRSIVSYLPEQHALKAPPASAGHDSAESGRPRLRASIPAAHSSKMKNLHLTFPCLKSTLVRLALARIRRFLL